MPFIAERDDETVIPEQVADDERVRCRECGEEMHVRGRSEGGKARHFSHAGRGRDRECRSHGGPGESATHLKWKSLAVSALRQRFDDYRVCAPEVALDVSATETDVDERRADALLEFDERNRFYGRGIIVEVQHLNVSKDIRGTTHDYLECGYSVYWATEDDFDDDRFDVERMEAAFNDDRRSAFSVYRSEPPRLDVPEPLAVLEDDEAALTTANPVPECSHDFIPDDEGGRVCVRCGLRKRLSVYNPYTERYHGVSGPSEYRGLKREYVADKTSVERPIKYQEVEEYGEVPKHTHSWRHVNDLFDGKKHECRFCDATLIIGSSRIAINHE